jgi:5-methylcytosine-specific restriction endonuclease McrA
MNPLMNDSREPTPELRLPAGCFIYRPIDEQVSRPHTNRPPCIIECSVDEGGVTVPDSRAYLEAMRARDEGREYLPLLARSMDLTVEQVAGFRDVAGYVAAVESGEADGEELEAWRAVIRFHWRELHDEERRALHRMHKRRQERRRRARLATVEREPYTREEIGDRDGWECGHCLTAVPREVDPRDPRAPQVDHITAIAQGGADTRDNVTISHRYCNADRWGSGRR